MNDKFIHPRVEKRKANLATTSRHLRAIAKYRKLPLCTWTRGRQNIRSIAEFVAFQANRFSRLATLNWRRTRDTTATSEAARIEWKPMLFLARTAECSAYQRQTPPRRFEPEFAFTKHSDQSDYPARAVRTRWPIIPPKSLELFAKKNRRPHLIRDLNHKLANRAVVEHSGLPGRESVESWEANSVKSIFRILLPTAQFNQLWLASRRKSETIFNSGSNSPIVYDGFSSRLHLNATITWLSTVQRSLIIAANEASHSRNGSIFA